VRFKLRSWWHCGTGQGVSSTLDALVARDADGLPCLPGKTVKGLLRDAFAQWEYWESLQVETVTDERSDGSDALTVALFGGRTDGAEASSRYDTTAGMLDVRTARMDETLRAELLAVPDRARMVAGLTATVRSTAIDHESSVAVPHSLRAIEVAVPLEVTATVSGPDSVADPHSSGKHVEWVTKLAEAVGFLQGLGSHRLRGLGRVEVAVEEAVSDG
jgi:hypothetical protein